MTNDTIKTTVAALVRALDRLGEVYDAHGVPRGPTRIVAESAVADGRALLARLEGEAAQPVARTVPPGGVKGPWAYSQDSDTTYLIHSVDGYFGKTYGKWYAEFFVRCLNERFAAALPEAQAASFDYEQELGNLLARIHGDGGHYIQEHGWQKAVADADAKIVEWQAAGEPQQPEPGHATRDSVVCASTGVLPKESNEGPPTEALWLSPAGIEYRRQDGRWRRYSRPFRGHWNGSVTVNMLEQEMLDAAASMGAAGATKPNQSEPVWCGCGDGIMPDTGAKCGTCVHVDSLSKQSAPGIESKAALTDQDVSELRAQHGWAKETIRAIERAILERAGSGEVRNG